MSLRPGSGRAPGRTRNGRFPRPGRQAWRRPGVDFFKEIDDFLQEITDSLKEPIDFLKARLPAIDFLKEIVDSLKEIIDFLKESSIS